MNVIFLDFDGVLYTAHGSSNEDIERRIKTLGDICHEYDCKVVIEASGKEAMDEEFYPNWLQFIFDCFKKYEIECIGRTPCIRKYINEYTYTDVWKDDEIRLYLFRHPEIEHYCVIDDDDLAPHNSDLDKVRPHLVTPIDYSKKPEEEGLLESHISEVGEALKLDNEVRKLSLRRKK